MTCRDHKYVVEEVCKDQGSPVPVTDSDDVAPETVVSAGSKVFHCPLEPVLANSEPPESLVNAKQDTLLLVEDLS